MPPFRHKAFVWPTIRTITIRRPRQPSVSVDASVSIDTGRPIVDVQIDDGDNLTLTPVQSRRLAAALLKAASCCDAKATAARA